jgi:hypothetical protein
MCHSVIDAQEMCRWNCTLNDCPLKHPDVELLDEWKIAKIEHLINKGLKVTPKMQVVLDEAKTSGEWGLALRVFMTEVMKRSPLDLKKQFEDGNDSQSLQAFLIAEVKTTDVCVQREPDDGSPAAVAFLKLYYGISA